MINHHPHTENGVLPFLKVSETYKTDPQINDCGKGSTMFQNQTIKSETKLMSISGVAKYLSLGRDTVKSLIQDKRIRAIQIGKRFKISSDEIARFLSEESRPVEIRTAPTLNQITAEQFMATRKTKPSKFNRSQSIMKKGVK